MGKVLFEDKSFYLEDVAKGDLPEKNLSLFTKLQWIPNECLHKWCLECEKDNKNKTLKRGDRVIEKNGHKGIVVKIIKGTNDEDHGTIYIWQEDRDKYGADNCEHYAEINWKSYLRIIGDE